MTLSNQKGNSLLFIIVGLLALTGTCFELLYGGFSDMPNLLKNYRLSATRDALETNLMNKTSFPGIYRTSIQPEIISKGINSELYNCIAGLGSCQANTEIPVLLYSFESDPNNNSQIVLTKISGGSFYDSKGNLCAANVTALSKDCPFEVTTTFTAKCLNNTANCDTAQSLQIHYSIQTANSAVLKSSIPLGKKERIANAVAVNSILPIKEGTLMKVVQINLLSGVDVTQTTDPAIVKLINDNGITDSKEIAALINIFDDLKITDPALIKAVAHSGMRSIEQVKEFVDIIERAKITNPDIISSLARLWERDRQFFSDINKAITQAGITDKNMIGDIVDARITDPAQAALFPVPKDKALVSLILQGQNGSGWQIDALTTAAMVANIPVTDANLLRAIGFGQITSPKEILAIKNSLEVAGITDQLTMNAIAGGRITDPTLAKNIAKAISDAGITDPILAEAIANGKIVSTVEAMNFADKIGPIKDKVNIDLFATRAQFPSISTFNNFVDTVLKYDLGQNWMAVQNTASIINRKNLTSASDIDAVIANYIKKNNIGTTTIPGGTSTSTSTTSTTSTTTTTSGSYTPSTLQLISGSCTTNCGGSAF